MISENLIFPDFALWFYIPLYLNNIPTTNPSKPQIQLVVYAIVTYHHIPNMTCKSH
jgi:hypothetical protein